MGLLGMAHIQVKIGDSVILRNFMRTICHSVYAFKHLLFSFFYERPVVTFQLHKFKVSTSRIHDFSFTNSRFQLHEFTISTSRIQLHEFTNSTSRNHEFNFMNSRIQLHEFHFTNSTSRIHEFSFKNSRIQLHEVEFVKLNS